MRILPFALIALVSIASAQKPPAPQGMRGPGGPGGGFEAMRKWRDSHPNVIALGQTISGLSELQQDPKLKLKRAQAQTVLAVISQWKPKKALTEAQAKQVNAALLKPLSAAQKKKVETARQGRMMGGPGRPGAAPTARPGGPGGPVRPGGAPGGPRMGAPGGPGAGMQMPAPKDYNPLNPSTLPFPPMRERAQERMTKLVASLKATK
ncbi:MAG TPA: hypothetical protein VGE01_01170 [Fimbriimonas sp.]